MPRRRREEPRETAPEEPVPGEFLTDQYGLDGTSQAWADVVKNESEKEQKNGQNADKTFLQLQEMFKNKIDPDVIHMVLTECDWKVDDALSKLFMLTSENDAQVGSENSSLSMRSVAQTLNMANEGHAQTQSDPIPIKTSGRGEGSEQVTSPNSVPVLSPRTPAALNMEINDLFPAGNQQSDGDLQLAMEAFGAYANNQPIAFNDTSSKNQNFPPLSKQPISSSGSGKGNSGQNSSFASGDQFTGVKPPGEFPSFAPNLDQSVGFGITMPRYQEQSSGPGFTGENSMANFSSLYGADSKPVQGMPSATANNQPTDPMDSPQNSSTLPDLPVIMHPSGYIVRKGHRKKTLSLDPAEREALENLIEDVIITGVDEGVIDSDQSSDNGDSDDGGVSPLASPVAEPQGQKTPTDTKDGVQLKDKKGKAEKGKDGSKVYPAQLKVAVKHMKSLPPRFLRRLQNAQQLETANAKKMGYQLPPENVRFDPVPAPKPEEMYFEPGRLDSPKDGRDFRDRGRSKEDHLKEKKKRIRNLLDDLDQYTDETTVVIEEKEEDKDKSPAVLQSPHGSDGVRSPEDLFKHLQLSNGRVGGNVPGPSALNCVDLERKLLQPGPITQNDPPVNVSPMTQRMANLHSGYQPHVAPTVAPLADMAQESIANNYNNDQMSNAFFKKSTSQFSVDAPEFVPKTFIAPNVMPASQTSVTDNNLPLQSMSQNVPAGITPEQLQLLQQQGFFPKSLNPLPGALNPQVAAALGRASPLVAPPTTVASLAVQMPTDPVSRNSPVPSMPPPQFLVPRIPQSLTSIPPPTAPPSSAAPVNNLIPGFPAFVPPNPPVQADPRIPPNFSQRVPFPGTSVPPPPPFLAQQGFGMWGTQPNVQNPPPDKLHFQNTQIAPPVNRMTNPPFTKAKPWPHPSGMPLKPEELVNNSNNTAAVNSAFTPAAAKEKIVQIMQSGQKVMVILRGLPGSGKSTIAKEIQLGGVVLSADDYFLDQAGVYQFDQTKIGQAHEWNQQRAKTAIQQEQNPIIIDNTNLQSWQMKYYVSLAQTNNYCVEIMEPDTPWKFSAKELSKRNLHGVGLDVIHRMLEYYEHNVTPQSILGIPQKLKQTSTPTTVAPAEPKKKRVRRRKKKNKNVTTEDPGSDTKEESTDKTMKDEDEAKDLDDAMDQETKDLDYTRDSDRKDFDSTKDSDTAKSLELAKDSDAVTYLEPAKESDPTKIPKPAIDSDSAKDLDPTMGLDLAKDLEPAKGLESDKESDLARNPGIQDAANDRDVANTSDVSLDDQKSPSRDPDPVDDISNAIPKPVIKSKSSGSVSCPDSSIFPRWVSDGIDSSPDSSLIKASHSATFRVGSDDSVSHISSEDIQALKTMSKSPKVGFVGVGSSCETSSLSTPVVFSKEWRLAQRHTGTPRKISVSIGHLKDALQEELEACDADMQVTDELAELTNAIRGSIVKDRRDSERLSPENEVIVIESKTHRQKVSPEMKVTAIGGKLHSKRVSPEMQVASVENKSRIQRSSLERHVTPAETKLSTDVKSSNSSPETDQSSVVNQLPSDRPLPQRHRDSTQHKQIVAQLNRSVSGHDVWNEADDITASLRQADDITASLRQADDITASLRQADDITASLRQADDITASLKQADDITASLKQADHITTSLKQADDITTSLKQADDIINNLPGHLTPKPKRSKKKFSAPQPFFDDSLREKLSSDVWLVPDFPPTPEKKPISTTPSQLSLLNSQTQTCPEDFLLNNASTDQVIACKARNINSGLDPNRDSVIPLRSRVDASTSMLDDAPTETNMDALEFLGSCFPTVPVGDLKDILTQCVGDLEWAVNILLDSGYTCIELGKKTEKDQRLLDSGFTSVELGKKTEKDQGFGSDYVMSQSLGDVYRETRSESPAVTKIKTIHKSASDPAITAIYHNMDPVEDSHRSHRRGHSQTNLKIDSSSIEKSTTIAQSSESDQVTGLQTGVQLSRELAKELVRLFGPVGLDMSVESLCDDDLYVSLDINCAQHLYTAWAQTLHYKNSPEMTMKRDEAYARSLQAEEEMVASSQNTPTSLTQIMREERLVEQREQSSVAASHFSTPLKREELRRQYPLVDPQLLDRVLHAHQYNMADTMETLEMFSGPPAPSRQQEAPPSSDSASSSHSLSYHDYRAQAAAELRLRRQCFDKAQRAYERGMGHVASYHAEQGHVHGAQSQEANRRAVEVMLNARGVEGANLVDLHGLHVHEALSLLQSTLARRRSELRDRPNKQREFLCVVTGRGIHSRGGEARIRPAVISYLTSHHLPYTEPQPGLLRIHILPTRSPSPRKTTTPQ